MSAVLWEIGKIRPRDVKTLFAASRFVVTARNRPLTFCSMRQTLGIAVSARRLPLFRGQQARPLFRPLRPSQKGSGANSGCDRSYGFEPASASGCENGIPNVWCGFVVDAKLAEVELAFPDAVHKFDAGDCLWSHRLSNSGT